MSTTHFRSAPATPAASSPLPPWRILIVDDEVEVHSITRLALRDCSYLGRPIELFSAISGIEARSVMMAYPDIAVAFIDVVMETDRAGLDLVEFIRDGLDNQIVQLIMRTGQAGIAPERQVVNDYDVNGYLSKSSVTTGRLFTATMTALRAYSQLQNLMHEKQLGHRYSAGLKTVLDASSALFELPTLPQLAQGLLQQLDVMFQVSRRAILVEVDGLASSIGEQPLTVLAFTGACYEESTSALDPALMVHLKTCMAAGQSVVVGDVFVGRFNGRTGTVNLVCLDGIDSTGYLDLALLKLFFDNISIAFDCLHLARERNEVQAEVIMMMCGLVESRCTDSFNHVRRVAKLSRLLAQTIGLPPADCDAIFLAAPLHDIGKLAIPDAVRLKKGPLNAEEWQQMKQHARIGQELFSRSTLPVMQCAALVAGQHHERFDGSGYPLGLHGEQINIFARIVAVVDAFDALLHRRCYKPAWPLEAVLDELRSERDKHFDGRLVDAFVERVADALALIDDLPDAEPSDALSTYGTAWSALS